MSRRIFAVAALLAVAAPHAFASDAPFARFDEVRESLERMTPRLELTRLFARIADGGFSYETEDGVASPMGGLEVIVVRIGTDGKPVMACVDNEKSAHRFFDAPIERVQGRKAQDQ